MLSQQDINEVVRQILPIVPQIVGPSSLILGQVVYTQQGTAGNIPLAAAFSVAPVFIMGVFLTIAKRTGAFDAL